MLVLRGEVGIGKTALLEYIVDRASGCRTTFTTGIQSETELSFARLHQLCEPMATRVAGLPGPQRDALATAFGLQDGPPPDQFLVGLAVLGLLADAAQEQPLVCLVDDVQWLDRASLQPLAFVARRARTDGFALVFAVRESAQLELLAGLPELLVHGLDHDDAAALLATRIPGPVDDQVCDRILTEARGNPRSLLELPRGLTAADLAAGFAADPTPSTSRVEQGFVRRLDALPPKCRRALLAAAAEPTGDADLFWRALERLGIDRGALGPAVGAGLIEVGARVRFGHPLLRSAAYRSAGLEEQQYVHAALAAVTDAEVDRDRRTWHRALAAQAPDANLASELEDSADRARDRGSLAAASTLLDHAATLTPDSAGRGERRLVAARAKRDAGAPAAALRLLVGVRSAPSDRGHTAEMERLRGEIALDQQLPRDAARFLGSAARQMELIDPRGARETHLHAVVAAIYSGSADSGGLAREAAEAPLGAPAAVDRFAVLDVLLEALTLRVKNGHQCSAPILRRALDQSLGADAVTDVEADAGCMIAVEVWDYEASRTLAERRVRRARQAGALVQLQRALVSLGTLDLFAGAITAAVNAIEEERLIAEMTGNQPLSALAPLLGALQGDEAETLALTGALLDEATARGHARLIDVAHHANAILYNGLGNYEAALDAARHTLTRDVLGWGPFIISELAEAASRAGDQDVLERALDWVAERSAAAPTDWALGMEARIRALLSGIDIADGLHRKSIELLRRTPLRVELARGHLLYGEWLRREGRRRDARAELRTAYETFTAMGLEGFAERARRELEATGERVRKRTADTASGLTPHEAEIVRLASDGKTNPEIGAQLFISARTVEWHLRKVFTKMGITSRRQLRDPVHAFPGLR